MSQTTQLMLLMSRRFKICNKAEAVLSGVLSVRVVSGFVMICLVLSCVIARVVSGFDIVRAEFFSLF
jgi:hypothetical protein